MTRPIYACLRHFNQKYINGYGIGNYRNININYLLPAVVTPLIGLSCDRSLVRQQDSHVRLCGYRSSSPSSRHPWKLALQVSIDFFSPDGFFASQRLSLCVLERSHYSALSLMLDTLPVILIDPLRNRQDVSPPAWRRRWLPPAAPHETIYRYKNLLRECYDSLEGPR